MCHLLRQYAFNEDQRSWLTQYLRAAQTHPDPAHAIGELVEAINAPIAPEYASDDDEAEDAA